MLLRCHHDVNKVLDTAIWSAYYDPREQSHFMDLTVDKEAIAIQSIVSCFASLAIDEQHRVLAYINLRYRKNGESVQMDSGGAQSKPEQAAAQRRPGQYPDAATLFERASPQSCSERALVAGYWFQVAQSQKDFQSGALAGVVAELGHPTKNMTRDLRPLLTGTPKLMIQVGKGSGNTSHRYRLTTEGVRAVENKTAV
jgi:hypothetical protein